jgi:hypothetical protein
VLVMVPVAPTSVPFRIDDQVLGRVETPGVALLVACPE